MPTLEPIVLELEQAPWRHIKCQHCAGGKSAAAYVGATRTATTTITKR